MSTCSRETEQNSEHRSEGNTIGRKKIDDGFKTPQARYDSQNTTRVAIKLNNTTDADILLYLSQQDNKQGYIKSLIRKDMESK